MDSKKSKFWRWFFLLISAGLLLTACDALPAGTPVASSGIAVWIDQPPEGAELPIGPFTLKAHARADSGIAQIGFLVNSVELGSVLTDPSAALAYAEFNWNPSSPGSYLIQVYAVSGAARSSEFAIAHVCVGMTFVPSIAAPGGWCAEGGPSPTPEKVEGTPTPTLEAKVTDTPTPQKVGGTPTSELAPTETSTPTFTPTVVPSSPTPIDASPPNIDTSHSTFDVYYDTGCGDNQVEIYALVTDPSGVASATLWYRYRNSSTGAWWSIPMSSSNSEDWYATITPGSDPNQDPYIVLSGGNGYIDYYVVAVDTGSNSGFSSTDFVNLYYCPP